ncbi:MAG TPA: SBBP repeat-containing protein, partial [bacterium]
MARKCIALWLVLAMAAGGLVGIAGRRLHINKVAGARPLTFEANRGQTDPQVKFLSRSGDRVVFLTSTEAVLALSGPKTLRKDATATRRGSSLRDGGTPAVLRMTYAGASPNARVTGLDEFSGNTHYFTGNHPAQWRTNIPTYARVQYAGLYPGVDLIFYGDQRKLEYDFVVQPGADPGTISLDFQGAQKLEVNSRGDLALQMREGVVWHLKPVVYQDVDGARRAIAGRFVVKNAHVIGFQVSPYDTHKPLVIDPVLTYSTYLGGSGDDGGYGIAVDGSGNFYVTGGTASPNFPTTAGAYKTTSSGAYDAFVAKFTPRGSLVYSTYLGGSNADEGYRIVVDDSGSAYVTGATLSKDFPTTAGAPQATSGGAIDVFVAKLDPSGASLVYSTYLGGSGDDWGQGIAVDGSGSAYVTGYTSSRNFPTASAFQATHGAGTNNVFVAELDPSGSSLVYSTYLGGSGEDQGNSIAVDDSGNTYVTGGSTSPDFPTTAGAYQTTSPGAGSHAFMTELDPSGAPVYSTYLGGSGQEIGYGIAVDGSGNAYVTGATASGNFPTTAGAYQTTFGDGTDVFVTKLNPSVTAPVYSTFLGGTGSDWGQAIAVDGSGNAYVTGYTNSRDFPIAHALQTTYRGGTYNVFVTELDPNGATLVYSTYLGGSAEDQGHGIAVDGSGNTYVTGYTNSTNFPTTQGAFRPTVVGVSPPPNTMFDGFVAKISSGSPPPPPPPP